jgi:hypothetical protein
MGLDMELLFGRTVDNLIAPKHTARHAPHPALMRLELAGSCLTL